MTATELIYDQPSTLIRDLSDEEFEERYSCDRFTATVLASRYALHRPAHVHRACCNNAFSRDPARLVRLRRHDLRPARARTTRCRRCRTAWCCSSGTMTDAVRNAVVEYGPENLNQGDILIVNDPYRIGTHVNDVCFIRPVFHDGEIVSFVNLRAHMLDMGGVVPGGLRRHQANVYENGLVIPPQLLYRDDKPVTSALEPDLRQRPLRRAAAAGHQDDLPEPAPRRAPDAGDDRALRARRPARRDALRLRRLGRDDARGGRRGAARRRLRGRGQVRRRRHRRHRGRSRLKVKITKRGHRVEVDLSGSSRQARTSINAGWLDTKTAVGVAFKFLFDPRSPFTSGAYRDIDIVLPAGTRRQRATRRTARSSCTGRARMTVLQRDLPGAGQAARRARGRRRLRLAVDPQRQRRARRRHAVGDGGAVRRRARAVGRDHATATPTPTRSSTWPTTSTRPPRRSRPTSRPSCCARSTRPTPRGPGANRGGAAVLKDTMFLRDAEHYSMPLHTKRPQRHRRQRRRGRPPRAACWVFPPRRVRRRRAQGAARARTARARPRRRRRSAGVLDPETKRLDPRGRVLLLRAACRSGRPSRTRSSAT